MVHKVSLFTFSIGHILFHLWNFWQRLLFSVYVTSVLLCGRLGVTGKYICTVVFVLTVFAIIFFFFSVIRRWGLVLLSRLHLIMIERGSSGKKREKKTSGGRKTPTNQAPQRSALTRSKQRQGT